MLSKYVRPGVVFTFADGLIGVVTKGLRLSISHKSGWTTSPERMPVALDFVNKYDVVKIEQPVNGGEDRADNEALVTLLDTVSSFEIAA